MMVSLTACVRHAAAVATGTAGGWRHDPASPGSSRYVISEAVVALSRMPPWWRAGRLSW